MRLDRRIRALERRYEARLNAAIERELARFTPEEQEELLRNFAADYERETGSEAAAYRTAILCSLVQTCKHLQINPFVYLRDIIERVSTHPAPLVLELTPREWKRLRQDSAAQAAA